LTAISQTSFFPKKDILKFVKYYKYVILFNSERIFLKDKISFDHFIGPCSGFKPFLVSELYNTNPKCKITFFDFNQSQIYFYKALLKWNGKNFQKFVDGFFTKNKEILNKVIVNNLPREYLDRKMKEILSNFKDEKSFIESWNKFRKKDINFVFINAITDYKNIIPLIDKNSVSYLWLSNIYNFEISNHRYGKEKCLSALKKLLTRLVNKNIYIDLETENKSGVFSPKCALKQIFNLDK
jgi:hypothetical protein